MTTLPATTHKKLGLAIDLDIAAEAQKEGVASAEILEWVIEEADKAYDKRAEVIGEDQMRGIEKQILLQVMDQRWQEHIQQIDQLRSVIGLRSYGQRDPLNEFKSEAFNLFDSLLSNLRSAVTMNLNVLQIRLIQNIQEQALREAAQKTAASNPLGGSDAAAAAMPLARTPAEPAGANEADLQGKVPRNAPCPCGSGKKFKHCHGKLEQA